MNQCVVTVDDDDDDGDTNKDDHQIKKIIHLRFKEIMVQCRTLAGK
jgi:hypothetical protein